MGGRGPPTEQSGGTGGRAGDSPVARAAPANRWCAHFKNECDSTCSNTWGERETCGSACAVQPHRKRRQIWGANRQDPRHWRLHANECGSKTKTKKLLHDVPFLKSLREQPIIKTRQPLLPAGGGANGGRGELTLGQAVHHGRRQHRQADALRRGAQRQQLALPGGGVHLVGEGAESAAAGPRALSEGAGDGPPPLAVQTKTRCKPPE